MSGHAIQRLVRQSPRKMRLVVDLIRGKDVNEAYAILKFNKKLAAKQIAKTLKSAVANAEQKALKENENFACPLDNQCERSQARCGGWHGDSYWQLRLGLAGCRWRIFCNCAPTLPRAPHPRRKPSRASSCIAGAG